MAAASDPPNNNTLSDLKVGMAAAADPPPVADKLKVKCMSRKKLQYVLSRIFRSFNLTKTTTQQKALVLLCLAGAILDPLFFYIPMINMASKHMKSDHKLAAVAISLRSLVDVLHFLLWSFYYEKKWKTRRSKFRASTTETTAASKISIDNPNIFSPRNSKVTGRLIEILCILPLPQVATEAVTLLQFSVLSQFVVRIFRVFPTFREAMTNSVMLLKGRFWIGAGFNLLLFVIASHVLGAFWYLLSAGRLMDCWTSACKSRVGCNIKSLYSGGPEDNKSYLDDYCPIQQATNSLAFDFGIYLSALQSNIVGSTRFPLKLIYCFWWGLRNLSSLGQNLTASTHEWEIVFSICFSISGLILFSLFIGNMQAFFQYRTNEDFVKMKDKMNKIEKKRREVFKWESFQRLPKDLQDEIILCANESWLETTEVNLQTMLDYLPNDIGKRIKITLLSDWRRR